MLLSKCGLHTQSQIQEDTKLPFEHCVVLIPVHINLFPVSHFSHSEDSDLLDNSCITYITVAVFS